jgi:hypothetical protein
LNGKTGCALVTEKMNRRRKGKNPAVIEFPFEYKADGIRSATEAIREGSAPTSMVLILMVFVYGKRFWWGDEGVSRSSTILSWKLH